MKPFGVLCGQNFRISMYARGSMDDMHSGGLDERTGGYCDASDSKAHGRRSRPNDRTQ